MQTAIPPTIKIAVEDYVLHDDYIEIETNGKEVRIDRGRFESWVDRRGLLEGTKYAGTADERQVKIPISEYWQSMSGLIKLDLESFLNIKIREIEQLFPNGSYSVLQQIVRETI